MTISTGIKSGYIYVIRDESQRRKLGFAEDVDFRRNELQTGNAEVLTIEYRLHVKDMRRAEAALHQLFAADRILGEWFNIRNIALLQKIFNSIEATASEQKMLESLGLR